MKKKAIISSLILLGCVVSIHAQVVKGTQGSNGAGGGGTGEPTGPGILNLGSGALSIGPNFPTTNLNVGIGTNNPSEKLEVIGNILANVVRGSAFTSTGPITSNGTIQGSSIISTGGLNASTGYFSGNVGIGTANPSNVQGWSKVLDVAGIDHSKILATCNSSAFKTGLFSHTSWNGGGGFVGTESNHTLFLIAGYDPKVTILTNGNVGVGTPGSPLSKFQVEGDISSTGINQRIGFYTYDKFTNASGTIASYGMSASRNPASELIVSHSGYLGMNFYSLGTERMRITKEGDISIGNVAPHARLQVEGDISSTGPNQRIGFSTYDKFTNASGTIAHYGMSISRNAASQPIVSHSGYFGINFFTVGVERMRITDGGYVGIGSLQPDEKLSVKGKIHAEEVKVDLGVPADYVFEKYYLGKSSLKPNYTLLTLSEVEKFAKVNHHLPNVPSAKEIKENGLLLGEMSNILLQKIEELTLYSIEQQKTIDKLEKENEFLKKLEDRLAIIEKVLEVKK